MYVCMYVCMYVRVSTVHVIHVVYIIYYCTTMYNRVVKAFTSKTTKDRHTQEVKQYMQQSHA